MCLDPSRWADPYRAAVRVVSLAWIAGDIEARDGVNGVRLVGVNGPSGSGKSTLARRLSGHLAAPVVEIDDFLSWGDLEGWWPRFESEVVRPLLAGGDPRFRVRDWSDDEFGSGLDGWKTVKWNPTVVVDGLTCTRRAVAARLAYRVWVDAPEAVRLVRGVRRDGETHRQLWLSGFQAESAFFAADGTRLRADLRVDGAPTAPHDPDSEVVVVDL
jgi:energy-coupling factor transporter ATP-binding protein EcfA2